MFVYSIIHQWSCVYNNELQCSVLGDQVPCSTKAIYSARELHTVVWVVIDIA